MKKIILSLAVIGVVGGLAGGATWAFFTGQAQVSGNSLSTTDADLEISAASGVWDDQVSGIDLDNIYPGWTETKEIQLRVLSGSDRGMDIMANTVIDNDNGGLKNVITLQFFDEDGEAKGNALTLAEWQDQDYMLEHIASGDKGEVWTLEFAFPSKDEDQNDLKNKGPIEFDVIFDGTQAETPITVAEDGSGDYETIQDAIDAAEEGDTIEVKSGTYQEMVEVNKVGLTINGLDGAVIQNDNIAAGGESMVTVTADNVRVEGLTVHTQPSDGAQPNAIIIDGDNGEAVNNIVKHNEDPSGHPLIAGGGDSALIQGNELHDGVIADWGSGDVEILANKYYGDVDSLGEPIWFNGSNYGNLVIENNDFTEINHDSRTVKILDEPESVNGETVKDDIETAIEDDNVGVDSVLLQW